MGNKSKLLLHSCCAPCFSGVYDQVKDDFDITAYWFNPNIYPEKEHKKRLGELIKYAGRLNLTVISEEESYDKDFYNYLKMTNGLSEEPEGGKRCSICIKYRLLKTALYAKDNGFDQFGTTLSISPYKDSMVINQLGKNIEIQLKVNYLEADFSSQYKRSVELSKVHKIYRQKYCGCPFSIKPNGKNL